MTSLDKVLSFLGFKNGLIGAVQFTPWSILLIVTESQFLAYSNKYIRYNAKMKFLEKRTQDSIDVHLCFDTKPRIDVTFRIINYLPNFFSKLSELFPIAEIYIQEIEIISK
ncbi:MAG: hypothetical protein ACFE95_14575 [Candidatus Hodarchaeota archaeon]